MCVNEYPKFTKLLKEQKNVESFCCQKYREATEISNSTQL